MPKKNISDYEIQLIQNRLDAAENELSEARETIVELRVKLATARLLARDYAEKCYKLEQEITSLRELDLKTAK